MAGETQQDYVVLARKYRSRTFAELIGQDALVRTLTHAIAANKIHHAYVLTGIRGVGKTSTARLLAKALNCDGGPSITWEEDDPNVQAINAGTHPDVLEFDAASNRGVEEVAQLFSGVNYAPVLGRYKVYIIDEVHMLSTTAFNALLKTLEEPPAKVKFVFATTEVHKIPVTVLSRCQRFDLKRVPVEVLEAHYSKVLGLEHVLAEPEAVRLIARAADGSVRDGLSLLDQAIALSGGTVKADVVRDMLGLADRGAVMDLVMKILRGDSAGLLASVEGFYAGGQDALLVGQAMLDILHLMTRIKLVPALMGSGKLTEQEEQMLGPLAATTGLSVLNRVYQVLVQGLREVKEAEASYDALGMVLVRAAYVGQLPALEALMADVEPVVVAAPMVTPRGESSVLDSWEAVVKLVRVARPGLAGLLAHGVRCLDMRQGELCLGVDAGGLETPESLVRQLKDVLREKTGQDWVVRLTDPLAGGRVQATLGEVEMERKTARVQAVTEEGSMKALLEMFPGAVVEDVIEDEREDV